MATTESRPASSVDDGAAIAELEEAVARQRVALFLPLPGGGVHPDPARAAALTWLTLLSLWGQTAKGA